MENILSTNKVCRRYNISTIRFGSGHYEFDKN